MILTLIRHGESVANKDGIWQGQLNFPLSTKGLQQAKLVGQWLSKGAIDVLYSSDLERALHTAQEIARHHPLKVRTTMLIREMNLGRFQGLTRLEVEVKYPKLVGIDWHRSDLKDVEQIDELYARARKFIKKLRSMHYGRRVVAVSHGGFINGLLMALLHIEWQGKRVFTIKNTSITTIDFTNPKHFVILGVNETPHLQQI